MKLRNALDNYTIEELVQIMEEKCKALNIPYAKNGRATEFNGLISHTENGANIGFTNLDRESPQCRLWDERSNFDIISIFWYYIYMKKAYRRTKTTVSMVNYHTVIKTYKFKLYKNKKNKHLDASINTTNSEVFMKT